MRAHIYEAGDGWPEVGDYVSCDGELCRIESMGPRMIQDSYGFYYPVRLSLHFWGDVAEDEIVYEAIVRSQEDDPWLP